MVVQNMFDKLTTQHKQHGLGHRDLFIYRSLAFFCANFQAFVFQLHVLFAYIIIASASILPFSFGSSKPDLYVVPLLGTVDGGHVHVPAMLTAMYRPLQLNLAKGFMITTPCPSSPSWLMNSPNPPFSRLQQI